MSLQLAVTPDQLYPSDTSILHGGYVEAGFIGSLLSLLRPPENIGTSDWSAKYRYLAPEASEKSGKFDPMFTPYFQILYHIADMHGKKVIVGMKAAQIGYTEAENNIVGRLIHQARGNIMVLCPSEQKAKDFSSEKFKPMVTATPVLSRIFTGRLDVERQTWARVRYPGGFMKFPTAGSPSAMKSTAAPNLFVEEPDDVKEDVKGQGNGLTVFEQRFKTFLNGILMFAGTPTEKGSSHVDEAYKTSKRYKFWVDCHDCGEEHQLSFDHLHTPKFSDGYIDPVYGDNNYREAYYACPHCGSVWDFTQKNLNVRNSCAKHGGDYIYGFKPEAPEAEVWGIHWSELLSPFPGSTFDSLEKSRLDAERDLLQGKEGKMISYVNNRQGLAYEKKSDALSTTALAEKAMPYPSGIVPLGGVVCTAQIDVQHDRFSVTLHAHGRHDQMWLVHWIELYGDVKNPSAPVWNALENMLRTRLPYLLVDSTIRIPLSNISMDVSDGTMSEILYRWILLMASHPTAPLQVTATKGWNETGFVHEIYEAPKNSSAKGRKDSLAKNYGITIFMVGTQKGKAEVHRRLAFNSDTVASRIYYPSDVREDYFAQLMSAILDNTGKGKKAYVKKPGSRDEALDCTVLAIHAAKRLYLHLWSEAQWGYAEQSLLATQVAEPELLDSTYNLSGAR